MSLRSFETARYGHWLIRSLRTRSAVVVGVGDRGLPVEVQEKLMAQVVEIDIEVLLLAQVVRVLDG